MANFHVGQKVVCVDDAGKLHLTKGAIYTIADIRETNPPLPYRGCSVSLFLEGVESGNFGFATVRFRPIAEKPVSMDIIRSIVADPTREIPDDPREPKRIKTPAEVASIPGGLL